ncbi:hypothetical protein Cenrod_1415 [Candidatus Symbiobacter mobilis CR]|uniref:Uncharacterized protein n=1 Tax=Candidatus Symbiobacter mobilis CR TaxID=946483 RepID=U5N7Y2_9BURK|nr:hypothetical protein Cenrod_1415 [Candidatus Symbiobacter mobilis CR]
MQTAWRYSEAPLPVDGRGEGGLAPIRELVTGRAGLRDNVGTKKRQQQDIDQAVALWADYKRRKASTLQGK